MWSSGVDAPGRFRLVRHGMRIIQQAPSLNALNKRMSNRVSEFGAVLDFLSVGLILAVQFSDRMHENCQRSRILIDLDINQHQSIGGRYYYENRKAHLNVCCQLPALFRHRGGRECERANPEPTAQEDE